jgi:hypothetical protein
MTLRNKIIKAGVPVFYVRRRSDSSDGYIHEQTVAVAERLWARTWRKAEGGGGLWAAYQAVKGTRTKWYEMDSDAQFKLMEV